MEKAAQLREAVRPFADKARQVQVGKGIMSRKGTTAPRNGETAKIRAWGAGEGVCGVRAWSCPSSILRTLIMRLKKLPPTTNDTSSGRHDLFLQKSHLCRLCCLVI